MKKSRSTIGSVTLLGVMLITTQAKLVAQADVESTTITKTTTTAGTISEFSPETIVIKTETSPDPVRYSYTKTTTYVDESGAPVSMELVKSGIPVTVYYDQDGDRMVASKVIVRKAGSITTTTTAGTISEFGPKMIVVKTETSPDPLRYSYTKTTTYVDESGVPVSMALVKSGIPVTVYYDQDGDRMVASKVIVRKAVLEVPPAPIIEEKKTTTTTITE